MSAHQFSIDFTGRLPISAQLGMKQCDDSANEQWKHIFDACVLAASKKKPEITSDDVLDEIESLTHHPSTHNQSAIGPAMKRAAEMGVIRATERVKRSERAAKKGNLHRVWESLYWTPF